MKNAHTFLNLYQGTVFSQGKLSQYSKPTSSILNVKKTDFIHRMRLVIYLIPLMRFNFYF